MGSEMCIRDSLYFDPAVKCTEAGDETNSESISSLECDRQERDARDRDGDTDDDVDDEDAGEDRRALTACNEGSRSEEAPAEAVHLPLHVQGARKTIRVCFSRL